jgi:hypothetical protein
VSVFHERFGHKCAAARSAAGARSAHDTAHARSAPRLRNFGALIGLAGLCLLPASLFFSTLLASSLYDREARAQAAEAAAAAAAQGGAAPAASEALYCSGPACFRTFFLIMAGVAALQCAVAGAHWHRMGGFYTRLAAKRAAEKNA